MPQLALDRLGLSGPVALIAESPQSWLRQPTVLLICKFHVSKHEHLYTSLILASRRMVDIAPSHVFFF